MTEQPGVYQTQNQSILQTQQERDRLLLECQQLLVRVAKRPNSLKLLSGIRDQLRVFAQYKSNWRKSDHSESI